MSIQKNLLFLLLLSFAISCSSSAPYFIEPTYEETKSDLPVAVMPLQKEWFSENMHHNFGNLTSTQKRAFNSFLAPLFSENISSSVNVVGDDTSPDENNFKQVELRIGDSKFRTFIPNEDLDLGETENDSRFIILLDQYYFQEKVIEPTRSSYVATNSESKNFLYFETKYVYWDKVKKMPVAWGTSNSSVQVNNQIKFSEYSVVLGRAIKNIAKWGPVQAKP